MLRLILLVLFLTGGLATASAQKRLALVVGIDAYPGLPADQQLKKAVNDARSMDAVLRDLGFDVRLLTNATRDQINVALDRLETSIEQGDTVFVFFSGHGVEIDNANFLLAADVRIRDTNGSPVSKRTLQGEAFNAAKLVSDIKQRGARTVVAVFDACRDAPFDTSVTRGFGVSRGLARMEPPSGVFVMFSAGAKQRAVDRLGDSDPDPNSVFTRVLVPLIRQPGASLLDIAKQLQPKVRDLAARVGEEQIPAYYDEIVGQVVLVPATAVVAPPPVKPDDAAERLVREQRELLLQEAERLRREAAEQVEVQKRALEVLRRKAEEDAEKLRREAALRVEAQRAEALRLEAQRLEAERLRREAEERAQRERAEADRRARETAERIERERQEAERLRREAADRLAQDREAAEWQAELRRRIAEVAALKRLPVNPNDLTALRVCNRTADRTSVAIAHRILAANRFVVEGWWTVEPGACLHVGSFARGDLYIHASGHPDLSPTGRGICVSSDLFAYAPFRGYQCAPRERSERFTALSVQAPTFTLDIRPDRPLGTNATSSIIPPQGRSFPSGTTPRR